jgi:hypothetical protein
MFRMIRKRRTTRNWFEDFAWRFSPIAAVLEREPAPISSLRPMSPPLFDWIVKVCLAKDPDERWQTVHDVKLQLAAIVESGSQTGTPALRTARGRLKQWMVWPAGAVLFVGGGLAGRFSYSMWHDSVLPSSCSLGSRHRDLRFFEAQSPRPPMPPAYASQHTSRCAMQD